VGRGGGAGIVEELELVAAEARPRRPGAAPIEGARAQTDAGVAGLAVGFLAELKLDPQRGIGKRLAGIAEEAEAETVAVAVASNLAQTDHGRITVSTVDSLPALCWVVHSHSRPVNCCRG
jgi:hypothetical protein